MAGLITFAAAGVAFVVLGLHQALTLLHTPSSCSPTIHYSSILLSVLTFLSSLLSILLSLDDPVSVPLSFSLLALSLLFLLHSLAALRLPLLPPSACDVILLFAFLQEFLFLKLSQRVNDAGDLENRYLDLMLVPVGLCAVATGFGALRPGSVFPPLARAIGLVFHGTWLLQMGFSFFTTAISHGCMLQQRSWANYTIKCKGHAEYHRSRAIATLQFNCHLAFCVLATLCVYSAVSRKVLVKSLDYSKYRPLGQMQTTAGGFQESSQFTLDDDEHEEGGKVASDDGIVMEPFTNLPRADAGMGGTNEAH